ncbi:MAG: type II toxin-antitoxin system prevent-host-death family antitoxin [Litorimonas sp.]
MQATTSTEFRKNLSKMMDKVVDDRAPLIINRANGKTVVVLSMDDYNAMDETAYLLSSPANRKALLEAVERDRKGQSKPRKLIDVDD